MHATRHIAVVLLLLANTQDVFGKDEKGVHTEDRRLLLSDPQTLLTQIEVLQREMQSVKTEVNTLRTQATTQQTQIHSLESQLSKRLEEGGGSIYIVWGKKTCPAVNGTVTVYSGIAAGGSHADFGGAVDTLCLPHDPDKAPSNFPTRLQGGSESFVGNIYGSEYQFTYKNFAEDDDVPCAVCSAHTSYDVMMVPAKVSCPTGWTMQYSGFLTSEHTASTWRPAEYLCLHQDAGYMTEGARQHNHNGRLFYPVKAVCGSLPCPPYENGQYITCVVCTQ